MEILTFPFSAVLGAYFLKEELGTLGKLGCAICLIGSVIIVLHAPPDKDIETVDEILNYAIQPGMYEPSPGLSVLSLSFSRVSGLFLTDPRPGFLFYCATITIFLVVMIYRVAPSYGKRNPLVYISICSAVGSITVMSVKAFGIALKLTFDPDKGNQFSHPSTYVFAIVVIVCVLTQMNYFNKALSQFSTSM